MTYNPALVSGIHFDICTYCEMISKSLVNIVTPHSYKASFIALYVFLLPLQCNVKDLQVPCLRFSLDSQPFYPGVTFYSKYAFLNQM